MPGADTSKRYYYPRLGRKDAVRLNFRSGTGLVPNKALVQLRTLEYLKPLARQSPYFVNCPAIRNFLGAWKDDDDCYYYYYYYSTNDAEDYRQQYWKVTRKDGKSAEPLRYGDRVYLRSVFKPFKGQRLMKADDYLSTSAGADEWWTSAGCWRGLGACLKPLNSRR